MGRGALVDDDVGMSDASEGSKRRGRQAARKSGPMGERPLMKVDGKPYHPPRGAAARNAPSILREETSSAGRARSTSAPTTCTTTSSSSTPVAKNAIDTLRLFLQSRYSEQDKMLNLENMASDTILKAGGIKAPGEKGAPGNIAAATWKLVSQLFPEVVSLSLANNNLTSILPLSPFLLTSSIPNLQNVSLASNSLRQVRDLDPLSPAIGKPRGDGKQKGWPKLQELVLTGNPMVATGDGEVDYKVEIARRFPNLRQLDQLPLDPNIAFTASAARQASTTPGLSSAVKRDQSKSAPPPVVFPVSVSGGFFESDGTRDFVAGFLMKFFPAFDNDRPSLAPVYSPVCTFSYAVDTTIPVRSRVKKIGSHSDKRMPNQYKLNWENYLAGSRNLNRVNGPAKRVANLHVTPDSVTNKLAKVPLTSHPLAEAAKFVFDAWTMPGLLAPTAAGVPGETVILATVHGEFIELPAKGVRSFDRTFILAPAPPTSPAALAGWPCMILSDLFTVRGYTDPSAWAPKPVPTAAPPVVSAPPSAIPSQPILPVQERADGLTDEQQALVLQLQAVTRLTYSFAHLCLVQNGWVPATALANFQALQASGAIPAEAFLQ